MKWPLYLLFAGMTFAAGLTALSRGWNLPPQAPQTGNAVAGSPGKSGAATLPACCAECSHTAGAGAKAAAVLTATTNDAGEQEFVPACCAGKKHAGN
jgi:hypothetical protein